MDRDESIRFATKYLEDLLSFFGINVAVWSTVDDEVIQLSVPSTSMNSLLIGKNAENLRCLQHIVSMSLVAKNAELTRVNVDIADYNQYAVSGIGLGSVEITDSTINGGGDADGVHADSEINMTITDTTIENVVTGITAETGATVTVVGGEISGENGVWAAEGAHVTLGGGVKVNATDDAVKVEDGGLVEIKSGEYTGDIDGLPGDVSITGGKYDRALDDNLVAEGAMAVEADDGWFEVRRTLKIYDFVLEAPMKFTAIKVEASGNLRLSVNDGIKVTRDAEGLPFSADEPVDGFYVLSRVSMTETTYRHVPATLVSYDGENATLVIKAKNLPAGGRLIAYGLSLDAE